MTPHAPPHEALAFRLRWRKLAFSSFQMLPLIVVALKNAS